MNINEWGFYVIVTRTGLTVRAGRRGEAFGWLSDADADITEFEDAMEALNSDGWHHSFHPSEAEALELAHAGVWCHGQHYDALPRVED